MAIYHFTVKNVSRGDGRSAVRASAYRSGAKLHDEETGQTYDYTKKSGVEYSEVFLCENAPSEYQNRSVLWNEVQKAERSSDARLCREWEAALPNELPFETCKQIARDFAKSLTEEGMCVDVSIHWKDGNHHIHALGTTRAIKEDGTWAPKAKKVYDLDQNGERIYQKTDSHGRKIYKNHKEDYTDWNRTEKVEEWRSRWADICNRHLEQEQKIDHRSYERREIERIPTIHEGYAAREIEARGGVSELCEINREIKEANRQIEELNREQAGLANYRMLLINILNRIKEKVKEVSDGLFGRAEQTGEYGIAGAVGGRGTVGDSRSMESQVHGVREETQPTGRGDTEAFLRQIAVREQNSATDRADREAEQQRLRAEKERRKAVRSKKNERGIR